MTDAATPLAPGQPPAPSLSEAERRVFQSPEFRQRLDRRYRAEQRFKAYGIAAVLLAVLMLLVLLTTIVSQGVGAFWQTEIALEIDFRAEDLDPAGDRSLASLRDGNYGAVLNRAIRERLGADARDRQAPGLLSGAARIELQRLVVDDPAVIGTTRRVWVLASDDVDQFAKGRVTGSEVLTTNGIATPLEQGEQIRVSVGANDFSALVREAKAAMLVQAEAREAEAAEAESAARALQAQATETETLAGDVEAGRSGDRTQNEADRRTSADTLRRGAESARANAAERRNAAESLRERAAELQRQAADPREAVKLGTDLTSFVIRINGGWLRVEEATASEALTRVLIAPRSLEAAQLGSWDIVHYLTPVSARRLSDQELAWASQLEEAGDIRRSFNWRLFTNGDSREPEYAGVLSALVGSLLTLAVTLVLSAPIGVAAAVYLEEFAPKNRWTELIEVNINNLAAVPSIVFGLLGLAMFINLFGLPRSAPLVGGMVLALMTLPTIIIATRAALKAVPPSIREAALGIGASRLQSITHHVLPLAMPGILTGTIIGMAQALGETAPLLMIGMVAFIVDVPNGLTDPATVMPVQIFLWADSPERAFTERTSAAIMLLLLFLVVMNAAAVILRRRFERRW